MKRGLLGTNAASLLEDNGFETVETALQNLPIKIISSLEDSVWICFPL